MPPGGFKGAEMADVLVSEGRFHKSAHGIRKRSCFGAVLLGSVSGRFVTLQLVRTYIFTSKMTQNQGKTGCHVTVHVDESDERFVERSCCGCAATVRDNSAMNNNNLKSQTIIFQDV